MQPLPEVISWCEFVVYNDWQIVCVFRVVRVCTRLYVHMVVCLSASCFAMRARIAVPQPPGGAASHLKHDE